MSTYNVKIFQTEELGNYCSNNHNNTYKAAENVAATLEYVFDLQSGVDANAQVSNTLVPAPTWYVKGLQEVGSVNQRLTQSNMYVGETSQFPFSAPHPTASDPTTFELYGHPLDWWFAYLDGNANRADDSNLILSSRSNTSGGIASGGSGGRHAIAITGQWCAEFNPPAPYGTDAAAQAVQTAIHEIGHTLIESDPYGTGPGSGHHHMGDVIPSHTSHAYIVTPMSGHSAYQDNMYPENYCWHTPAGDKEDIEFYGFEYSDCAWQLMDDPGHDD